METMTDVALVYSGSPERFVRRVSPVTGQVLSQEAADGVADCVHYAELAAAAFPSWASSPVANRAELLNETAEKLYAYKDDLVQSMIEEIGTPRQWAAHNVEFAERLLRETAVLRKHLQSEPVPDLEGDVQGWVEKQACGVSLGIAPWNAPVILGVRALATPLLCGNTAILKGSELAPRTNRLLGQAFAEAGFPKDVVRVIVNAAEDSEAVVESLVSMPIVRRVNFTGSTRIGRRVGEICANHLKRPLLELGGQVPMLVTEDADIERAAEAAVFGAYTNQGQVCMSTERLIVADAIADDLLRAIEARRSQLQTGDPSGETIDLGPVVTVEAAERLSGLISDAVSKGAHLVGGGGVRDAFVEPTLLDGVESDMRLYREEAFGPILSLTRVSSDLEAITVANDSEYGLAASVFCGDKDRAETIARSLHSGICHINRASIDDHPNAPFGGVKASGYGRFGGRWAIDEFTELRWITAAKT